MFKMQRKKRPKSHLKADFSDWFKRSWERFVIGSCSSSGDWWSECALCSQAVQKREGLSGVASVFHHPATVHI